MKSLFWYRVNIVLFLLSFWATGLIFAGSPGNLNWDLKIDSRADGVTSLAAVEDILFRLDTGTSYRAKAAIGSNGMIYIGSDDRKLYAINQDGTVEWIKYVGEEMRSSPAIDKYGNIFILDQSSNLRVFDPDGNPKWNYQAQGSYNYSSPVIDDSGIVYFVSGYGEIYALLSDDGGFIYESDVGAGADYCTPVLDKNGVLYFGDDDTFYAVNTADGSLKWSFKITRTGYSDYIYTPAIGSDGTIYFASGNDSLYALDTTGTMKWAFQAGDNIESSPVIGFDETIIIGSNDNFLYALDTTGTLKWSFETAGDVSSAAVVGSDSTIYFASEDGDLYALSSGGVLKWKYDGSGMMYYGGPTLVNGMVICSGYYLRAVDTGTLTGPANTAWPNFLHDNRNTANMNTAFPNTQSDPGSIILRCGTVNAQAGTTVQVPIYMDNADVEISGGYFIITPLGTGDVVFKEVSTTARTSGWSISSADLSTGYHIIFYSNENELIAKGSGEIARISYEIDADVPDDTEITLDLSFTEFTNPDLVAVSTELHIGKINVFNCGQRGDLDSDGRVGIIDVLTMVMYARGIKTPSQKNAVCADLTGDSTIDMDDVLACVDIAVGRGTLLADWSSQNLSSLIKAELGDNPIPLGAEQGLIDDVNELIAAAVPGASLPKAFQLSQNVPNPFNPTTSISFNIPEGRSELVELKVFDVRGRLIKTLVEDIREAGEYTVYWDGTNEWGAQLSSGVYIYRLRAGSFTSTRKMVLLK